MTVKDIFLEDFVRLDDEDDVLDVINSFPTDMRADFLKMLSEETGKDESYPFVIPSLGYLVIMKLVTENDRGLILLGAKRIEDIIHHLEAIRDNMTEGWQKKEMQSRINLIRYTFSLLEQQNKKTNGKI